MTNEQRRARVCVYVHYTFGFLFRNVVLLFGFFLFLLFFLSSQASFTHIFLVLSTFQEVFNVYGTHHFRYATHTHSMHFHVYFWWGVIGLRIGKHSSVWIMTTFPKTQKKLRSRCRILHYVLKTS